MIHPLSALSCLLLLAPLSAQVVTMHVSTGSPFTAATVVGGQLQQSSIPAGPQLPYGYVGEVNGPASAQASWTSGSSITEAVGQIRHSTHVQASLPAAAAACVTDLAVEFVATTPGAAIVEITRASTTSAGAAWPTVQVDIGNDGTIDILNLLEQGYTFVVADFGTQPVRLRFVMTSAMVGEGFTETMVDVKVKPDNGVAAFRTALGCGLSAHALSIVPTFVDRGVNIFVPPLAAPTVLVFSLNPQPTLLPSFQGMPCLVVPAPDYLLFAMPGGLPLPLPNAVRPLQFHVQAVILSPFGLQTTDAFLVVAS